MVTPAPAALLLEPGAPPWAERLVLRMAQAFVPTTPAAPISLMSITQANLPPAAKWRGCIVFVSDLGKLGLSNGTAWVAAGGGPL